MGNKLKIEHGGETVVGGLWMSEDKVAEHRWLDDARQARALAQAYWQKLDWVLYFIQMAAQNGQMSVKGPSIFDTPLEHELHARGFDVRHHGHPNGEYSEISW